MHIEKQVHIRVLNNVGKALKRGRDFNINVEIEIFVKVSKAPTVIALVVLHRFARALRAVLVAKATGNKECGRLDWTRAMGREREGRSGRC